MNYIKLTGNNGSVANTDFYSFQLKIEETGQAQLIIKRGRESEEKTITAEAKKVSSEKVAELLNNADSLFNDSDNFAMVGGPEKFIEIKRNEYKNTFGVKDENQPSNRFYLKCLQLFDSGLKKRLDEII